MPHDVSLPLGWAQRAYDAYCAQLPPDIRDQLPDGSGGEAFVILYGPTQVGKTTLILRLLQLSKDGQERVGKTLRGNRGQGQSSTAVATQYRRSKDETWSLSWHAKDGSTKANANSIEASSDEEMAKKLGELREAMMQGEVEASDDYCTISIPASYFKPQQDENAQKAIRILDLPGVGAADEKEREYVKAISRKFVPIATLTLLVSKVDDLGFFFKGLDDIPEIKHWTNTPSRFRIITTYSFTSETTRKKARNAPKEKQGDIETYQQGLITQIETHGKLPERAKRASLYYPLEFGGSWENSKLKEEVSALAEMIDKEFDRLHADIAQADDPLNYLLGVLDSQGCAQAFYEERSRESEAELCALEKESERDQAVLTKLGGLLEEAEKCLHQAEIEQDALQDLSEKLIPLFWKFFREEQESDRLAMSGLLQKEKWDADVLKKFTLKHTIEKVGTDPAKEQALLPQMIYFYDTCIKDQKETTAQLVEDSQGDEKIYNRAWFRFWSTLPSAEEILRNGQSIILSNFKELIGKLEGYTFDTYFFDSGYKEDCRMFMYAYERSADKFREILHQAFNEKKERFENKIRKKREEAESDAQTLRIRLVRRTRDWEFLQQQLDDSRSRREQILAEWQETKKKTDNMLSFFDEEYFKELGYAHEAVYTTLGAGASLHKLCYAQTLKDSRNAVLEKLSGQEF